MLVDVGRNSAGGAVERLRMCVIDEEVPVPVNVGFGRRDSGRRERSPAAQIQSSALRIEASSFCES
jgi:hypothetical protein